MIKPRIIPILLLQNKELVKSVKFKDHRYVGDPINAVRIFSEFEADEIALLDIDATREKRIPSPSFVADISEESFMPVAVGGGIRSLDDLRALFQAGVEKTVINSYAVENSAFIADAAYTYGSQSIVVSIDAKQMANGNYEVFSHSGSRPTGRDPVSLAREVERQGAGELLINSIDRDGTRAGYDLVLINSIASAVNIPVIACGGARGITDFEQAIQAGASAIAAGSLFVFYDETRSVLINYPEKKALRELPSIE